MAAARKPKPTTGPPDELITIAHDGIGARGRCTRRQLEKVHAEKGWYEVPAAQLAVEDKVEELSDPSE